MEIDPPHEQPTLRNRIVSGSAVLLTGSGLTTVVNLAYNIAVARFLGPKGFGYATVVYTLLTLLSAVTLSFQIVSTKVVAQQETPEGKSAVYRGFHRSAWICGIFFAILLLLFKKPIADFLNLPDSFLVALLAFGAAFYVPLGTRRGYIQGTYGFRNLAANLVLEGGVRFFGSLMLILMGFGARGVIAANAAAVAVAYLAIPPKLSARVRNPLSLAHSIRESVQAFIFFSGQVLINNCDIVLVKHFFPAQIAGLYAAVAMVGRVIFAFSSAVVNTAFPIAAGTREADKRDFGVVSTSLVLVFVTGSLLALCLCIAPSWIWSSLFGPDFAIAGKYNLPYLLALYALATVIYSLSVVIITVEMSHRIGNASWVQLTFSALIIGGICMFHSSLREVILVQLVLMSLLFLVVAIPFVVAVLRSPRISPQLAQFQPVRLLRRASEDEAIGEFLRSDFHDSTFSQYRETLSNVVVNPNFDDPDENAKRRALFFLRHLSLWKELPEETEWYEAEINEQDLAHIRAFPRAQWRKLARGTFSITKVTEGLSTRKKALDAPFLAKIETIGERLEQEDTEFAAVLLIGVNENEPLTILDGNHRMVAAMLASPRRINKLRVMCGLSPRMTECCWYNTNVATLIKYGRNMITRAIRRPEAKLARFLQSTS